MKRVRVIPVLGIENGSLVKTTGFRKPNYIGDPLMAIKIFNDKEVDELLITDIRASIKGYEPDYALIKQMAAECFMPLGYGGGIRTADQGKKIFDLGIEKIVISTAFFQNPNLAGELASQYGNQSIVVCIDVKKNLFGKKKCTILSGSKNLDYTPEEAAKLAESSGAGELIVQSIDHEGSFKGYDFELIKQVANSVDIPVVALGGARNNQDFLKAITEGKASAVAAAATFVYNKNNPLSILINYPDPVGLKRDLYEML